MSTPRQSLNWGICTPEGTPVLCRGTSALHITHTQKKPFQNWSPRKLLVFYESFSRNLWEIATLLTKFLLSAPCWVGNPSEASDRNNFSLDNYRKPYSSKSQAFRTNHWMDRCLGLMWRQIRASKFLCLIC